MGGCSNSVHRPTAGDPLVEGLPLRGLYTPDSWPGAWIGVWLTSYLELGNQRRGSLISDAGISSTAFAQSTASIYGQWTWVLSCLLWNPREASLIGLSLCSQAVFLPSRGRMEGVITSFKHELMA